jgi:copper(I)-binding protein
MKEVDMIDLPAGEAVQLKPGGYHVMLMKLKAPITKGMTVPVTLTFEQAGQVTVDAVAKDS